MGHQAGDQAIRWAGRVLSGLFRASDIVGRLGGDEFAVFLSGKVTEKLVRDKASAICAQLQMSMGDNQSVSLTASVGVQLAGRGQAFEGLYRSADLALYKAKKGGKHRYFLKNSETGQSEESGGIRPVNSILLSVLLENLFSGVALVEMGEAPSLIYVSPSFCRIIGTDPASYPLPQPLRDLIHPDDVGSLLAALRKSLRDGAPVEHSHRVCTVDRSKWMWWNIRAVQIEYDFSAPVLLVTAMDVSQFKETERRQEEQIRRLRAALDQTSRRLWEVDVRTGVFRAYTRDGEYKALGDSGVPFPERLIEGWLDPRGLGLPLPGLCPGIDGRAGPGVWEFCGPAGGDGLLRVVLGLLPDAV